VSPHRGQYRTGGTRDGLFAWTPHGTEPAEMADNPRSRACPACHAGINQPCTRRSRGNPALHGYHDARLQD
jgi:hypothetical protein